jgi:hypothetical protein
MAFALRRPYRGAPRAAGVDPATGEARPPRSRVAAARGAWAVGSVMTTIARLVQLVVAIVVLLIAAAIVLRVASANPGNVIVRDIHDAAQALVGPFKNLFSIKDPKLSMAVNWGVAAIVYFLVGGFIARLIARAAPRGVHPAEPVV